jgi:hypothetical protein
MNKRNIDSDIISRMKDSAEKCEFFRFAPHKNGVAEMNNIYAGMTEVIVAIENQ